MDTCGNAQAVKGTGMKKKKSAAAELLGDDIGCIGDFNREDRICFQVCALRLRCAIESGHHIRSEILEELMFSETFSEKNQ
jgi:hypothetical protein